MYLDEHISINENDRSVESWEYFLACKINTFVELYIDAVKTSTGTGGQEPQKIEKIADSMNAILAADKKNNTLQVSQYIKDILEVPFVLGAKSSAANIDRMTIPYQLKGKKTPTTEEFLESIRDKTLEKVCFVFWLFYSLLLIRNDYKEIKVAENTHKGKSDNLTYTIICAVLLNLNVKEIRDVIRVVEKIADLGINAIVFESSNDYIKNVLSQIGYIVETQKESGKGEKRQEAEYVNEYKRYLEIKSGLCCVLVNTVDDLEAKGVIEKAADIVDKGYKIYCWDILHGLINAKTEEKCLDKAPLEYVIDYIYNNLDSWSDNRVFIFRTIEKEMQRQEINGKISILLEEIEKHNDNNNGKISIFLLARHLSLDSTIEKKVYIDESIGYPNEDTIREICNPYLDDYEKNSEKIQINRTTVVTNCKGMTKAEIERSLQVSISKSAKEGDLEKEVLSEKKKIIKNNALLEVIDTNNVITPCGLEKIKKTIEDTNNYIANKDRAKELSVDPPRGILITGIPGCGKSLSAKYAAKELGWTLLKLDMGNLMSKYQGESDHNFRDALKIAESSEPCVLWIDEMEKAFNASTEQSEASSRILGFFLSWLQEKKSDVFVIGTSNDISKLPPELTRLGRFDALFYVGLPNEEEIKEIFKTHIKARGLSFEDYEKLAKDFIGYSGAEIEQIVKEVNKERFAGKASIGTKSFLKMKKTFSPLSQTSRNEIEALEKTYDKRHFINASER